MLIKRGKIAAKDIKTGSKLILCQNCKKTLVDSEITENKCPHCGQAVAIELDQ